MKLSLVHSVLDSLVLFQSVFVLVSGVANLTPRRSVVSRMRICVMASSICVKCEIALADGTLAPTFGCL